MNYKYALVLTGCIGSGKSTVSSMLKDKGFDIIDADEISHICLKENQSEILKEFGTIERKSLGKIVFSDEIKRKRLESILHPKIRQAIKNKSEALEKKQKPYIVDIPLYFETNAFKEFKNVVLVYANKELCKTRIKLRDNLDEKAIEQRLNAQMDIEKKLNLADFVIQNTGSLSDLQDEVSKFLKWLKEKNASI